MGAIISRLAPLAATSTAPGTGFTTGGIAGSVIAGTLNSAGLSMNVPSFLTTAMASNRGSDFVQATAGFNGTNASGTIASNSLSVSVNPGLSAGLTSGGFSFGTSGLVASRLAIHVGSGLAGSQSVDGVSATLSILQRGAGVSNLGNTDGSTGVFAGRYVFVGSNNITLSQSTADAGGGGTNVSITVSGLSNALTNVRVSGGTTSNLLSALTFADSNGISWGLNASTMTADIGRVLEFDPFLNQILLTNSTLGHSSLFFAPFDVPFPVSASRLNVFVSITHTLSGAPNNQTASWGLGYGLYTRMTGTGTDRMSRQTSYSLSVMSGSVSSSTRLSVTHYIGISDTGSHSTSQYGVNNASVTDYIANSLAGYRAIALPFNQTLTPGRYWLGVSVQTATQNTSFGWSVSVGQVLLSNYIAYRPFGTSSAASNASFYGALPGAGTYSAQSAGWPVSIPLTTADIRGIPNQAIPYFNFSGIGTSTNMP